MRCVLAIFLHSKREREKEREISWTENHYYIQMNKSFFRNSKRGRKRESERESYTQRERATEGERITEIQRKR